MVDHPILIKRLETQYGITDASLDWIKSYLSGRQQCVMIGGVASHKNILDRNIPQGSIMGADFYADFTEPVEDVVGPEVDDHFYADDSQLYKEFDPNDADNVSAVVRSMKKQQQMLKAG